MRAGPDTAYPSVRSYDRGLRAEIYGCLSDRSWCDVGYGQDRGWVSGYDLAVNYQGRQRTIVTLSAAFGLGALTFSMGDYWDNHYRQRPFYNDRYRWERYYFESYRPSWGTRPDRSHWGDRTVSGYTLRRVLMRAGPDYGYPALARIASGRQIDIFGCLRDWSWCDVGYRSDRGWVPGRDLSVTYQGRRRSIGTIAPYLGIGVLFFAFDKYWDDHYRSRPFYRERDRYERHYNEAYKPIWGPRPDNSRSRDQYEGGGRTRSGEQDRQPVIQPRPQLEQRERTDVRVPPIEPGHLDQKVQDQKMIPPTKGRKPGKWNPPEKPVTEEIVKPEK